MNISVIPIKKKSGKRKYILIVLGVVLVVGIGAGAAAFMWYNNAINSPASDNPETLNIKVIAGETFLDIAPRIQKAGGLRSIDAMRLYMRLHNITVPIQVGTYEIPLNRNVPDLIAEILDGPELKSVTVTIREGLRADEIADVIATAFKDVKRPGFKRDEFMQIVAKPDTTKFSDTASAFLKTYKPAGQPLEGFLFPDTYNFGIDADSAGIISVLITNLITRLEENQLDPAKPGSINSFYSALNFASIVEKEAFDLAEKRMVADIFIRRINTGIGLGSDATILYPYKRWSPPPTLAELQADTPYNSRLRFVLPPTPIANPGIDSIKGVFAPTANDYYYFLHGKTGTIYYARTFGEHQQNINLYLQ